MKKTEQKEPPILIVYKGVSAGSRWPVRDESLTIGRAADCDVVLSDRQISRYHARIERDAQGYLLRDLGSKNGTKVNAEVVHGQPYRLRDGDEIELASVVQMGFVSGDATVPLDMADIAPSSLAPQDTLQVHEASRRVTLGRRELDPPLSPAQFSLLALLIRAGDSIVTRNDVVAAVWPDAVGGVTDQAVDALVYRLRERLAEFDPDHNYIVTVRGHGFRYQAPD